MASKSFRFLPNCCWWNIGSRILNSSRTRCSSGAVISTGSIAINPRQTRDVNARCGTLAESLQVRYLSGLIPAADDVDANGLHAGMHEPDSGSLLHHPTYR